MPIRIEAYTLGGIMTGVVDWPGHVRDALEAESELLVQNASFASLDGARPEPAHDRPVAVDDIVLAVPDEELPGPVHAAWHAIRIEAGPYVVEGELATMPGFDPGRALARPTGDFVLLRDVHVALLDSPDAGMNVHAQALVNRYVVDAVDADLMLGFFFPGARIAENVAAGSTTHVSTEPETPDGTSPDAGNADAGAVSPPPTTA